MDRLQQDRGSEIRSLLTRKVTQDFTLKRFDGDYLNQIQLCLEPCIDKKLDLSLLSSHG